MLLLETIIASHNISSGKGGCSTIILGGCTTIIFGGCSTLIFKIKMVYRMQVGMLEQN